MAKRRFIEDAYRREPWFRALCAALLQCETEEEVGSFLRDVATLSELQALSERLEVAKQLSQGTPYRQIARSTGASTTTVTRVAHFLENGEGGYRQVLGAHRHHRQAPQVMRQAEPRKQPVSVLQKYLEREKANS